MARTQLESTMNNALTKTRREDVNQSVNKDVLLSQIHDFKNSFNGAIMEALRPVPKEDQNAYLGLVVNDIARNCISELFKKEGLDSTLDENTFQTIWNREPQGIERFFMINGYDAIDKETDPRVLEALYNPKWECFPGAHARIAAHPLTPESTLEAILESGGGGSTGPHGSFPHEEIAMRDDLTPNLAIRCLEYSSTHKLISSSNSPHIDKYALLRLEWKLDKNSTKEVRLAYYKELNAAYLEEHTRNLIQKMEHYLSGEDAKNKVQKFLKELNHKDKQLLKTKGEELLGRMEFTELISPEKKKLLKETLVGVSKDSKVSSDPILQ